MGIAEFIVRKIALRKWCRYCELMAKNVNKEKLIKYRQNWLWWNNLLIKIEEKMI